MGGVGTLAEAPPRCVCQAWEGPPCHGCQQQGRGPAPPRDTQPPARQSPHHHQSTHRLRAKESELVPQRVGPDPDTKACGSPTPSCLRLGVLVERSLWGPSFCLPCHGRLRGHPLSPSLLLKSLLPPGPSCCRKLVAQPGSHQQGAPRLLPCVAQGRLRPREGRAQVSCRGSPPSPAGEELGKSLWPATC